MSFGALSPATNPPSLVNSHPLNDPQKNTTIRIDLHSLCEAQPLRPSLWKNLDMNSYLDHYPNGTHLSLEQYATRVGASDFQCGIGKICNPGQLCKGVDGRDWYALVAAQNWNNFVNMLYQAAGDAFDVASDVLPTMLTDFEKDFARTPRHFASWASLISNWISSFPASLFKSYGPIPDSVFLSWGAISWLVIVMITYQITAVAWLETWVLIGEGESRFKRSSSVTWMLGQAQHVVQGIISNITEEVLLSGVSTTKGLASINRDGIFTSGTPVTDRKTVQKEYEKVLKLKTLVKIWRIQNVFIVRGADPCTQDGTNGAFKDPKRLSYCGEDSVMMSIVRGQHKGDRFDPTIYRAARVESKYGFSTEYLTTTSWECQKKYGAFEYDPHLCWNSTDPHSVRKLEDCVVNLPVCDFTRADMKEALRQGISITKACRELSGLPI